MKFIIKFLFLFVGIHIYSQTSFWVEQVSGVNVALYSVVNSVWWPKAWICGANGTVLRTSNNGINWVNVSGNGIPNNVTLNTISDCGNFENYAITAGRRGDSALVYRTTNNGASWQLVFTQPGGRIIGTSLGYYSLLGFMVGIPLNGRWSVWKTTNFGSTWDSTGMYIPQSNSESGWNNSFMHNSTFIAFGTNNSRFYYSTNDGTAWSFKTTSGLSNVSSLDFNFSAPNFFWGYVAGTNRILFTSNSGNNWLVDTTMPGNGDVIGLHKQPVPVDAFGQNSIITTKGDNKIYWQFVYSNQWTLHFIAPAGNYTHIANKMYDRVWAVRDNGGITYCSCFVVGINMISSEIPKTYALTQNYPNPFNPTTNINFDLPKSGFVKLIIYDLLGREITQLVNQDLKAGSYNADWDAANYPSGVYFYSLLAGDYTETKKMVLVK